MCKYFNCLEIDIQIQKRKKNVSCKVCKHKKCVVILSLLIMVCNYYFCDALPPPKTTDKYVIY